MALHHFYWRGKERSVSITRVHQTYHLLFIDPDLTNKVGTDLTIENSKDVWRVSSPQKNKNVEDELLDSLLTVLNQSPVFI
jgi:hypothetical protein